MVCMADPPLVVVFGCDRARITIEEAEREDWPRVYIRAGGVAALCDGNSFWRLLAEGPVVGIFESRLEGHAVLEAYDEARRRRPH